MVENGSHCNGQEICEDESDKDEEVEPRGPKITVPGAKEVEEPEVKAIRGRRKPLYSSPAFQRATKSGPPSPKIAVPNRVVNGSPARTRLPHPPPLVREGDFFPFPRIFFFLNWFFRDLHERRNWESKFSIA